MSTRAFAVTLTIPDNEAFTALEALARLGIPVARVVRADVWLFDLASPAGSPDASAHGAAGTPAAPAADGRARPDDLAAIVGSFETIFNPNKHKLAERESDRPAPGEVWIASRDEAPMTLVAGRAITGVRGIRRRTSWRLLDDAGRDLAPADRVRAVETFLCNQAFQVAITA